MPDTTPAKRRRPDRVDALSAMYARPLPYSLEAEMAVLGSLLLDPRVVADVEAIIHGPEAFYNERHAVIYQTVLEVYDKIPGADLVPIVAALQGKGQLEAIGGPGYLSALAEGTPSAAAATRYAKIVSDRHRLRRLIEQCDHIVYDALHHGDSGIDGVDDIIDSAESMIMEVQASGFAVEAWKLPELLHTEIQRLEKEEHRELSGVPTGYHDLDKMLTGLHPGEMIVLAARPSMGKTSLAMNLVEQIARGGRALNEIAKGEPVPTIMYSLEMSKDQITQRLLSGFSGVNSQLIRKGALDKQQLHSLKLAAEGLTSVPIYIDDTPSLTIQQLRSRARRAKQNHQIGCIAIDYLQLLTSPGTGRENRQVEVSAISRGIKALARELEVPIIVLSQLNRNAENRDNNMPRMSDLRESGSIEQDADVVLLLHREDYYHRGEPAWDPESKDFDENNRDKIGTAEIIVAKQRNGPTGTVKLTWSAGITRFMNHSAPPQAAPAAAASMFDEPGQHVWDV